MFTGIVQGIATVAALDRKAGFVSARIKFPLQNVSNLKPGASIAIDGVCLTASKIEGEIVSFDIVSETLEHTTLAALTPGSAVNFERSLKFGDEIGGHLLSGHVDGTAKITEIEKPENNFVITLGIDATWMKYIFLKGYLAVNGASLTVAYADRKMGAVRLSLIPETLRLTTFKNKQPGDPVNFEIDRQTQIIVETTREFLNNGKQLA